MPKIEHAARLPKPFRSEHLRRLARSAAAAAENAERKCCKPRAFSGKSVLYDAPRGFAKRWLLSGEHVYRGENVLKHSDLVNGSLM